MEVVVYANYIGFHQFYWYVVTLWRWSTWQVSLYYISTNTRAGKSTMWVTGQWCIYHPTGLKLTWSFCPNNKLLSPNTPTFLFGLYGFNVLNFLTECCHKSQMLLQTFLDNNDTLSNECTSLKD